MRGAVEEVQQEVQKQRTLKAPEALWKAAQVAAKGKGLKRSAWVKRVIREAIEKDPRAARVLAGAEGEVG